MLSKLYFGIALLLVVNSTIAQNNETARLRLMQLSFSSQSAMADIQIDGEVVLEGISFPFTTDYLELTPGSHILTTMISGEPTATASASLTLEAGKSYSVIVEGDYAEGANFIVIDESMMLLEATASAAMVINLTNQPISNIALNDRLLIENIPMGEYRTLSLPSTEFTLSGNLGDRRYSETFSPHSNTLFLIVIRLIPSGEAQIIYHRSSPLTVADYLQSVDAEAQFSQIAEFMGMTDLLNAFSDDGEYTLFLPTNQALSNTILLSDADSLYALLSSHIITQNLPPYRLPERETLMTLGGERVSLTFGTTDSGYWEIEGVPILWDVRLANGVIYGIEGVINRSE